MRRVWSLLLCCLAGARAANPLVQHTGMADPHVRHFGGDRVYLYTTHDQPVPVSNVSCCTGPWRVWSSEDLVSWREESQFAGFAWAPAEYLHTQHLYWATDATEKDGRYYWYVSVGGTQIAVLRSAAPTGPWEDPLGRPLFSGGHSLDPPTSMRDPGVLKDDDGKQYVVFGACFGKVQPDDSCYYLAELNEDMISFNAMRHLSVPHAMGVYGPGKTDDKPYLHKRGGTYYLSWGCFYAMASSPWGPYEYAGTFVDISLVAPAFRMNSTAQPWYEKEDYSDRHGSFLEWHGQWYFFCNDRSHSDALRKFNVSGFNFRDTVAAYVHYFRNGSIAPLAIDAQGVNAHSFADRPVLPAENFFSLAGGAEKAEAPHGGFDVVGLRNGSVVTFGNVRGLAAGGSLSWQFANGCGCAGRAVVYAELRGQRRPLASCAAEPTSSWETYDEVLCSMAAGGAAAAAGGGIAGDGSPVTLVLAFEGGCDGEEFAHLDFLRFSQSSSAEPEQLLQV